MSLKISLRYEFVQRESSLKKNAKQLFMKYDRYYNREE